jgi:phage-related minor tail protein
MNWAAELAIMRRWTSVLGDALTPAEQLELRTIELTVALQSGAINAQQYARAIGAFTRAQDAASTATRNRLGIVTQEETLATRMRELDDMQARGYIRNAEERALAERLVQREVRETMEALRVRASETPALTRLAIDAENLQKTLDQSLAGALRGTTSTILEMAKGTKTLGQGFGELAERIAAAVAEAILLRTVVAPLANATIGALGLAGVTGGTAPNALGNVFAGGSIIPFARGGVVHRPSIFRMANGGLASMSEVEPEAVMPLRRLSSGRLGVEAVGGAGVQINIINNHASARITQREERDGRGGRRLQIQIEEMVAAAAARPGSPVPRALAGSGALVRL